jgi:hypothetical protein
MTKGITPLNALQLLVVRLYANGTHDGLVSMQSVESVGDTLFTYCVREAGELSGPYDLRGALYQARSDLNNLIIDLENE